MRTIKFRAWSKEIQKMYYTVSIDENGHVEHAFELNKEGRVVSQPGTKMEQDCIPMQFTGLKCPVNKDGFNEQGGYKTWQEIWEGDIVQFHSSTDFTIGQENKDKKFVVVYQAELGGGFCLKHISVYDKQGGCNEVINGWHAIDPYQFSNLIHHFNVIGNIYENPDLLKGENL